MAKGPESLLDRLVGWCVAVLVGALALTGAVWLLQDIWPALAIIGGCVVLVAGLVLGVRWWLGRW